METKHFKKVQTKQTPLNTLNGILNIIIVRNKNFSPRRWSMAFEKGELQHRKILGKMRREIN